jgi:DNA-binding PadR family transcriptional regulator
MVVDAAHVVRFAKPPSCYLYMCRVSLVPKFRVTDATLDVLEVLLTQDDTLYGLKIAKQTGRPTGSIFPILARLEEHNWVDSAWETAERPERGARRRLYRLNGEGAAHARELLKERRGIEIPPTTPAPLPSHQEPKPAPRRPIIRPRWEHAS